MSNDNVVRCLAVGDGFVGKTCLLHSLARKYSSTVGYLPTIFDNMSLTEKYNGVEYQLHLIDTAGQEEYAAIRTQSYNDVDVFLVCFSVENSTSFSNVQNKWLSEIQNGAKNATIILVGAKCDLRNDPETIDRLNMAQEKPVSETAALSYANAESIHYIECSSFTGANIDALRTLILEKYVKNSRNNQRSCLRTPVCSLVNKILCCRRY